MMEEKMPKWEQNMRYIRAKLPGATPEQLGIIAAFIQGLGVLGFDYDEWDHAV